MGPIGTLALQAGLIYSLLWVFGAFADLFLPPSLGIGGLALALGAILLSPRRVLMEFPVSFTLLGMIVLVVGSVLWSVDAPATSATQRALLPATFAIFIAAGLLTLKDMTDGLLWAIRIAAVVSIVAIILFPEARVHVGVQSGGQDDYAGWHGLFNHKNNMMEFFVFAIPTVLIFDKQKLFKWGTLGMIAILAAGSTSATGVSSAFFVIIAYVWLQAYRNRHNGDKRDSTLLFLSSVTGALAVVAIVFASFETLTNAYGKDTTLSGRTEIWEAVIDAIFRRPILGHGYAGLFNQEAFSAETSEIWTQVGFRASHAHSGVLDLVLQLGIVGLVIFAAMWGSVVWRSWDGMSKQPDLGIWILCIVSANLLTVSYTHLTLPTTPYV